MLSSVLFLVGLTCKRSGPCIALGGRSVLRSWRRLASEPVVQISGFVTPLQTARGPRGLVTLSGAASRARGSGPSPSAAEARNPALSYANGVLGVTILQTPTQGSICTCT
jgi:hypothetical protein